MQEEVTAKVQLIYSCRADKSRSAQSDMIHEDIVRLLDADSTTVVQLSGLTIQHVQSEAITHENMEPRSETRWQCHQMKELLEQAYPDAESPGDALMFVLCDLRHLADQEDLAFGLWDKSAYRIYVEERADMESRKSKSASDDSETDQGERS
ncbi:hypothetical protein [uncultured Tateyamaria sp.]|uniref:hypothetical protein n=1 Tax=uncultured Tateyamaria sp. TaxID=455651 RepID=UPI002635ACA2|nr:hypothetical protein [uncultured Tateyamaria sp.]